MERARIKGYVGIRRKVPSILREMSSSTRGSTNTLKSNQYQLSASSSSEEAAVSASLLSSSGNSNNNNNNNETDFVLNADGSILIDHKGVSRIVR